MLNRYEYLLFADTYVSLRLLLRNVGFAFAEDAKHTNATSMLNLTHLRNHSTKQK